jgi:hypothetical protein
VTRSITPLPARLRAGEATKLERQLLDAATREEPSPELSARMAAAIGVALPPPAPVAPPQAPTTAAATPAAASAKPLVAWIAGAAAVVAVGAAVVAVRSGVGFSGGAPPSAAPATAATIAPAARTAPDSSPAFPDESARSAVAPPAQHVRPSASADLGQQIALIDGARSAIAAGASDRALEILRKYQSEYPSGGFRPEATALKIEALVKLGRTAEARALAGRFVDEHAGTPIADRVARLAGLRGTQ